LVLKRLESRLPAEWLTRQLDMWPERALSVMSEDRIAVHLEWVWRLKDVAVLVDAHHHASLKATEYTIYTRDSLTPGIFSKIAGVLAAKGLQILDAQIATLADGVVVDTFHVLDADYPDGPEPRRVADIRDGIIAVLEGRADIEQLLREATRFGASRQGVPLRERTVVQVDNETSDRYTILDVFADDRQGLLYILTRAIFDLGLSVHAARIATKLDQAADVFYVTDQHGAKVDGQERCDAISAMVTMRIEDFLGGDRAGRPVVQRTTLP
jgi:[protein-PII] uridylyltransferase